MKERKIYSDAIIVEKEIRHPMDHCTAYLAILMFVSAA
jgi:hypothetical protein